MKEQTIDEQFLEAISFFERNMQQMNDNGLVKSAEIHAKAIQKVYAVYNRIDEELGQSYVDYVELREKYFALKKDTQKLVGYCCCKNIDPNVIFKIDDKVFHRMVVEKIPHTAENLIQTFVECLTEL